MNNKQLVNNIKISVIIPTYNRVNYLKYCLNSLLSQTLNKQFYEIIIVDDGSTDETEKYLTFVQKQNKFKSLNLKYYKQKNSGPAKARNLGASRAKGEIFAFLDDDCIAHKLWLTNILEAFRKLPDAAYIGGYVIPIYTPIFFKNITERMKKIGKQKYYKIDFCEHIFYTENSAIRKSIFFEMNGFNTKFKNAAGEDSDLYFKLLNKKYPLYFVYSIQVDHNQRDTLFSLFKRYYFFGKFHVFNYYDHYKGLTTISLPFLNIKRQSGFTFNISMNFFKYLLIILILGFFWPIFALILFLIILIIRYFRFKNIKTTLSFCLFDLITESAGFLGHIVGSFKKKIILI